MKYGVWLLLFMAPLAQAHEVHYRIAASGAVVVTLNYANGQPFAFENYVLTPLGQPTPQQVGNTDAQGRIAFVPGNIDRWRLQASSADGHGVNLEFTTPAIHTDDRHAGTSDVAAPRWLLALLGLALIFGSFGLIQRLTRKNP